MSTIKCSCCGREVAKGYLFLDEINELYPTCCASCFDNNRTLAIADGEQEIRYMAPLIADVTRRYRITRPEPEITHEEQTRCWSCGTWKVNEEAKCGTCYSEGSSKADERRIRKERLVTKAS